MSSLGTASFGTQANALLKKNLTFQKRNVMVNCRLVSFPIILCLLLFALQLVIDNLLGDKSLQCGCKDDKCGLEYSSTRTQAASCKIPHPPEWPPMLQVPAPQYRAVLNDDDKNKDLPDPTCRADGSCPVTFLLTGQNKSFGEDLGKNMFSETFVLDPSKPMESLASDVIGSQSTLELNNYFDPAFTSTDPIYSIQSTCKGQAPISFPVKLPFLSLNKEIRCVEGLNLWRDGASQINDELYKGYRKGNPKGNINEITAAYDFLNSDMKIFNVSIWYNSTNKMDTGNTPESLLRVPRSINMASNAYLRFLLGPATQMLFEFVKEMPKISTGLKLDLSSLLGTLFFTWVVLQLFPVILTALVYEKQQKLRIMMKMHGLGDGPYWLISYTYFLTISTIYMICFVGFGSILGLRFFELNDYGVQAVFYFIYINLQIAMAFLLSTMFSHVKTASVVGYICVFGTGLLGAFLFHNFVQDVSFPRAGITVMELYPGFALYRGLYEFGQYSFRANFLGIEGMSWSNLSDKDNGMLEVWIIMFIEWLVLLVGAYYIDTLGSAGCIKAPMRFLQNTRNKPQTFERPSMVRQGSKVIVQMDQPDVSEERQKVEQLLHESSGSHAIICDNLKKVYPGKDGNPEKLAVRGLSLALPPGECFGMLGPNGAGKTTFIGMMIGLFKPSSGTAFVQGLDIRTEMDKIYTSIGVCPQYDLLWETLTGREHLLFYGRLKNLGGSELRQAVEESLKSVNLFHGGVADKQAGKYSGGMKRRLSVAISLIGDPKVVYMDEPSTGLDPASRNNLWNVVKQAKPGRAIILTTHSMEEAEALCDRLGVFVDGSLQCIGNPKELKARYGGSYVFTMTTSPDHEEDVEQMVQRISPGSKRIYQISGTQKFELPKNEVKIADVFHAVEDAKKNFTIYAWGLADTTLEDVFIKVAKSAGASDSLT